MQFESQRLAPSVAEQPEGLTYLSRRVRQEAEAAIRAASVEATLIHVALATAYAKRFGEDSARGERAAAKQWVDENRVW